MDRVIQWKTMYDNFFRELITDFSHRFEFRIKNRIYFVNEIGYDTYYGLWQDKDLEEENIISLSPSEFVNQVINRVNS